MEFYVMNNVYDGIADYTLYRNIRRLGLIQNYTSIQWLTEFNDSGEFCIESIATTENINFLKPNNLVVRNDINEWAIGIIQKVAINDNKMTIRGTLDALDHLVNKTIESIVDIENGLGSILQQRSASFFLSRTSDNAVFDEMEVLYENYRDIIKKVCTETDLGYAMVGIFGVKLYSGNVITNTMLSDMLHNIIDQSIDLDNSNIKSTAIVVGEKQDSKATIVIVNNPIDVKTYSELFVDAKNISRKYKDDNDVEQTYTESQYIEILKNKGLEELEKHIPLNTFTCQVNALYKHFTLGVDYKLGDIIKVKSEKYNYNLNMRITKVREIFEENKKVIITLETKEGNYGN